MEFALLAATAAAKTEYWPNIKKCLQKNGIQNNYIYSVVCQIAFDDRYPTAARVEL